MSSTARGDHGRTQLRHLNHLRLQHDPETLVAAQHMQISMTEASTKTRRPASSSSSAMQHERLRNSRQPRLKAAENPSDAQSQSQPQPQQQQPIRRSAEEQLRRDEHIAADIERTDGLAELASGPAVAAAPVQRDAELEQARREATELRMTVQAQQREITNAMAQVHSSVRKREGHKADLTRAVQSNADAERRTHEAHAKEVASLRRELKELQGQLEAQTAWQAEESAQHALELRECLRKQQELQKWKNQRLEEKLLNATDLAHAEEQHAARQKEHERVLETRATEYARQRQQWKDGRDQDQMAHAHEVATLKKRNDALELRISKQDQELKQVRTMLEKERAEWDEERLKANVGLDQLASQHQQNLATQNNQLEELKLQAELKAREVEQERKEVHEVQEGLQRKVNDLVQMLHDLTVGLENAN